MTATERLYVALQLMAWWNHEYYVKHYWMKLSHLGARIGSARTIELDTVARKIQYDTER